MVQFNKGYKHKAPALLKKLDISEVAKGVDAANPNGTNQHSGLDKTDNVQPSKGGNSKEYRIAKLKRDHPEIAARLEAGEGCWCNV